MALGTGAGCGSGPVGAADSPRYPRSVRYLEAVGHYEQAEVTVRRFERSAKISYDGSTIDTPEQAAKHQAETIRTTGLTLFSTQLRRRTLAFWLVWFCINLSYYGAFIWIPSLLVKQGFTLVKSFEFTLIITVAQLPGYAVAAWLIEVIGRRLTLALFLAGSALSALGFAMAGTQARSSQPDVPCRFSTWGRGVHCMPSAPSCTPRHCAAPVPGGGRGGEARVDHRTPARPGADGQRRRRDHFCGLRGFFRDGRGRRFPTPRKTRCRYRLIWAGSGTSGLTGS